MASQLWDIRAALQSSEEPGEDEGEEFEKVP